MKVDDKVIKEAKNQIKALKDKISKQEQLIPNSRELKGYYLKIKKSSSGCMKLAYIDSDGEPKYERNKS